MNTIDRTAMRLKLDYNNMMRSALLPDGFTADELKALPMAEAVRKVNEKRGNMKWRELPHNQAEIVEKIKETAAWVRRDAEYFVVLGIGGSALGPIAVQQALSHLRYNDLPKEKRQGPKFYVLDNIDPETMQALLDVIDIDKTVFNVITKSGSTSETMSQLLIVVDLLKKHFGSDISAHLIATTDKEKGNLIKIAKKEALTTFVVPDGVGGRLSELCPVGLLPAAVCGIDIEELLSGAAYMDELTSSEKAETNPAAVMAALQFIAMQKGKNIHVMMPYADSLKYIADWYAQLWAESLGKKTACSGAVVHAGQTPVKSLGVTDQHSQVQLYTEGPFDKVVTFIGVEKFRAVTPIPEGYPEIPDVHFLSGHTHNELIAAEQAATEYALTKSGHINYTITLPEVNPFTVGELLYLFEVATAIAGELLDIDAFDQPGVEEGKKATYALLGKPGFDEKRAELAARPAPAPEFILN